MSKISLCVNRGLRGEPRDPVWARLNCFPGLSFFLPLFLSACPSSLFHYPLLSQINFLSVCPHPHCEQVPHCEDTGAVLHAILRWHSLVLSFSYRETDAKYFNNKQSADCLPPKANYCFMNRDQGGAEGETDTCLNVQCLFLYLSFSDISVGLLLQLNNLNRLLL